MAIPLKLIQLIPAAILGFLCISSDPANAAYVNASSDMRIDGLGFALGDPGAQLQWTDVWYGEVRAHAADSDSPSADDSHSVLSNNASIQATATTADVNSNAIYTVANGDQVGMSPGADVVGISHSDLTLAGSNKQADGFAVSTFNNLFMLSNPNAQGSVLVTFFLNYAGDIFGTADAQGFFIGITDIATLQLFDGSGTLLNFAVFQNSISGTNTTLHFSDQGVLTVSYLLDYNTDYLLSGTADSEIYAYTIPAPATLPLLLPGLAAMRLTSRRRDSYRF